MSGVTENVQFPDRPPSPGAVPLTSETHQSRCTSAPAATVCRAAFDFVRKHGLDAVRVLRLPANRGKGAAVKAGCLCARGQRVLFMDADGATKVSDMERLEARLGEVSSRGG